MILIATWDYTGVDGLYCCLRPFWCMSSVLQLVDQAYVCDQTCLLKLCWCHWSIWLLVTTSVSILYVATKDLIDPYWPMLYTKNFLISMICDTGSNHVDNDFYCHWGPVWYLLSDLPLELVLKSVICAGTRDPLCTRSTATRKHVDVHSPSCHLRPCWCM